ncbi:hypothetical protein RFM26_02960 [Mesorhizobium sp. VK23B]|uniref:Sugar phosphate isomerase/epimerase n=1 Tax=Mesorhizobium dulcispinae TaxID=3072316 RepID=A0ABU4X8C0_9HYPH|nr:MULTISPECIES: hypothetical protein [unclassified Mesorhizobium]MDX8464642.1 hypothetical protein [Mesorhizobium sp. VK23B]MDX8471028.1 hypothetical protein [Mesorhizobium sp. VK23A]
MTKRMAYNPISFILMGQGFKPELAPPLSQILTIVREAGYDGVHAEIPPGSTPEDYLALLTGHGLMPAPGYFRPASAMPKV